jgi:signal transduction histidine kinase
VPSLTPLPPPPLTKWQIIWRNLVALAIGVVAWGSVSQAQWEHSPWFVVIDLTLGVVVTIAYQFRRRWPFPVAMLAAVASFASASAAGAGTMAYVSLATRRRWAEMIPVAVVAVLGGLVFYATQPDNPGESWYSTLITGVVFAVIIAAIGMYIGARRDLLASLKERAERAEREQELQVARGQAEERTRIAREMHDVLAHRMSLVAMHAGALAYRENLTPQETREAAEIIQANSHRALTDLREILGVLRDANGAVDVAAQHRPQPTLCDLDELIADESVAGAKIKHENQFPAGVEVPESIGRAAYRIIQEGLTNARKHSPHTAVVVTTSGAPGQGLTVEVRNPVRVGSGQAPSAALGAGLGLIGLTERVTLAHGRIEHGRTPTGDFVLRAWLPWES